MQLLINIDADTYKDIKMGKIYTSVRDVPQESVVAIANGTPLSKELSELLAEQDMRIVALAYAHAHYLKTYGVDIDKALHTATENAEMMAKAYQQGGREMTKTICDICEKEIPAVQLIDPDEKNKIDFTISSHGKKLDICYKCRLDLYKWMTIMHKTERSEEMEATNRIPKWIPVRERLPEKSDDFLVSVINNKYGVVIVTEAYFESKNDHDDIEESKWRVGPNETVIAWMPEPEPYKEKIE